jgi:sterol desaturase/sphingolipid hydroxylase (fatty acid hydroxylase superfamily)
MSIGIGDRFASPRFHRWHHTDETQARDKNFAGLLPLWDILFGTYYMPKQQRPRSVGTETPVPAGLIGQMLFPFRKARFKVAPPEAPSGVGGGGARD